MSPLVDLSARVVLETIAYFTGKALVLVAMPGFELEPFERQRSASRWKWQGFTYSTGGRRFLYLESVQLLGLAVWIVVGAFVYAVTLLPE